MAGKRAWGALACRALLAAHHLGTSTRGSEKRRPRQHSTWALARGARWWYRKCKGRLYLRLWVVVQKMQEGNRGSTWCSHHAPMRFGWMQHYTWNAAVNQTRPSADEASRLFSWSIIADRRVIGTGRGRASTCRAAPACNS